MFLPGLVLALAQSADTAEERARLANERIRLEAEQRAREEQEREQQAETSTGRSQVAVEQSESIVNDEELPISSGGSGAEDAIASTSSAADMTQILEQLRTLGELRDAGYVTEEEFNRIKQRILNSQF